MSEPAASRRWIQAAAAGVVLLFLAVSIQKIWAGDFWGQLRTGQWILEALKLPVADDYSFTAAGREVREVRWLYCVVIAIGWKVGAWFLCLAQAAVLGAMWAVIVWPVRRVFASPLAWVMLALAIAGGAGRWVLRPELATDLFIAVFLVMLEGLRRRAGGSGGRVVGLAWWLVAAQVLWVNLHSVYVFGPVLAWLFAGSIVADRVLARAGRGTSADLTATTPAKSLVPWPSLLLALAVTGACWVNPYFHRGAIYAVEMWREAGGFVGEMLGEMKSPLSIPLSIWRWDFWCAAALTGVVVVTTVLNWRRMNAARLGVLVMALYLGATAQRNLPLLVIMGLWVGLGNLSELRASGILKLPVAKLARVPAFAAVALGSTLLAWYVATDRAWISISAPRETGLGVVEWDVPSGAVDFVVSTGCRPQVYNHMREGHYLGWRSGGRIKVFIDGRTDVFGDEFLREYMSTRAATWDAISAKWGINTAIVPVRGYEELIGFLSRQKDWALVYFDHRNLVFVRRIPENAGIISDTRFNPASDWTPGQGDPDERGDIWKRLIGGRGRPWYSFGMAQTFLAIGAYANAERYLKATLERYPSHERALAELAAIERFNGNVTEGDRLFSMLRPRSEWAHYSERTLANRLFDVGKRDQAVAAMERAVAAGEKDPLVRITLGDWHFGANNFAAARPHYEAAIKAGIDTAADWKKLGFTREKAGELPAAAEAYERSLKLDATQHEVWYLLGLVEAKRGNRAGAQAALERAVRISPDFAPARKALEGLGR